MIPIDHLKIYREVYKNGVIVFFLYVCYKDIQAYSSIFC